MFDYDLQALRVREQKLAERRSKLLEKVTEFRIGLLDGLGSFFRDATKVGLGGATPCEGKQATDDILEVAFTLNDRPLLLVWIGDVLFRQVGEDLLASRAFVYPEGQGPDTAPWFQIEVSERGEKDYCCSVCCRSPGGGEIAVMAGQKVGKAEGIRAARALVGFMYDRLRHVWAKEPPLGALQGDRREARRLGFSSD